MLLVSLLLSLLAITHGQSSCKYGSSGQKIENYVAAECTAGPTQYLAPLYEDTWMVYSASSPSDSFKVYVLDSLNFARFRNSQSFTCLNAGCTNALTTHWDGIMRWPYADTFWFVIVCSNLVASCNMGYAFDMASDSALPPPPASISSTTSSAITSSLQATSTASIAVSTAVLAGNAAALTTLSAASSTSQAATTTSATTTAASTTNAAAIAAAAVSLTLTAASDTTLAAAEVSNVATTSMRTVTTTMASTTALESATVSTTAGASNVASTAAASAIVTASLSASAATTANVHTESPPTSSSFIVGIAIGSIGLLLALGAVGYFVYARFWKQTRTFTPVDTQPLAEST